MYNMPGDGGHALRITWRPSPGKQRVTWVGTRDAPALVAAIESAQARLAARDPEALGEASGTDSLPPADDDR